MPFINVLYQKQRNVSSCIQKVPKRSKSLSRNTLVPHLEVNKLQHLYFFLLIMELAQVISGKTYLK